MSYKQKKYWCNILAVNAEVLAVEINNTRGAGGLKATHVYWYTGAGNFVCAPNQTVHPHWMHGGKRQQ